jgi:hypothetical protein
LDEQLRRVKRVLDSAKMSCGPQAEPAETRQARLDATHSDTPAWHVPAEAAPDRTNRTGSAARSSLSGAITWSALSLGVTALVCGGILLGWSMVTGRQELWSLGLPIVLGGQLGLVVGLILQLDHLWHDSRRASEKLDHVDQQLVELKHRGAERATDEFSGASTGDRHRIDGPDSALIKDLNTRLERLSRLLDSLDD